MTNEMAVRMFMVQAGQDCPLVPTIPSTSVRELRDQLIDEESIELYKASINNDLVEIADAVADLLYVTYGYGIAYGLPVQKVFDEVHRSNMSKFLSGHKDKNGKWQKGSLWTPPNIARILDEHKLKI